MAARRPCRLRAAAARPIWVKGPHGPESRLVMDRLRTFLAAIAPWLDMLSGAYGATAAVRLHERPTSADLKRLGIAPQDFTVRF